ncbi:MAG: amidoligase family protein [Bacteroidia bacterium]
MTHAQQQIVNSREKNPTKIKQLAATGLNAKQIATMLGLTEGYVRVYMRYRMGNLVQAVADAFMPTTFNRRFGVEIEAYNVDTQELVRQLYLAGVNATTGNRSSNLTNQWKVTTDSSINGAKAFEIVSPILVGEEGLRELEIVCTVLAQMRAKVNKSCGMHIHIDAERFTLTQWKNLLKNYGKAEALIDSFLPISRRGDNNHFCKSVKNRELQIDNATTLQKIAKGALSGRYYKVNVQSYFVHKTVEFRQHSGTIEYRKISNWVRFLHNLVTYSETHLIEDATLEGLATFNQAEIVSYFDERIGELN